MKRKNPKYPFETILLLDDDELANFINQKVMESCNFAKKIYVNSSAKSALEFLNNLLILNESTSAFFPEIIFIDLNMPLMDGFQFIISLLKNPNQQVQKIKLVILTSSVHEIDRQRAEEISKNIIFLNKPLTKEILDTLITT